MKCEATRRERPNTRPLLRIAWWVVFVFVLITVIAIRLRLLGIPLERHEGEYAYAGQLPLHGIPPYQLAYKMKFPGVNAAYALIMALFGQTPAGVHSLSPEAASRELYCNNPFVESIEIAKFVREHTDPSDDIAVLGSKPEIYFYSHRHSATGYIYTYALMEARRYARKMRAQMIQEIEKSRPRLVALFPSRLSLTFRLNPNRLAFRLIAL